MENKTYLKMFLRYASLNVLGSIGLSCYILADTFFIARGTGTNGLAALNLALPVFSLINGSGLMLGMGGATRYSIFKGQGAADSANRVFTHTLAMAVVISALFVFFGAAFSRNIVGLLGADENVFEMTNTYLEVLMLFSPAFILNNVFISFVRNDGQPQLAMLGMLVGSLFNIIMDYLFIFPLGLGILGAVLATGFSPGISMLILSRYWFGRRNQFHLVYVKPQAAMVRSVVLLGLPSLLSELSSGIVMLVFNFLLLSFGGNEGVAAYGVVANISLVVVSVYTGISQGIQPLLSRACGQGDRKGIGQVLRYAQISQLAISALVYAAIFLFAGPIASIFNSEGSLQLQELAVPGLRLYFTAAPFVGFNIILAVFFTSIDHPLPAHVIMLLRGLVLMVPMALLLARLAGLTGVWLAFPATEGVVAAVGALLLVKCNRLAGRRLN